MKKHLLLFLLPMLFVSVVRSQLVLNFQFGASSSFSHTTASVGTQSIIKHYPLIANTYSIGAGYMFSEKTILMVSYTLNSIGWIVRMKDSTNTFKNDGQGYYLKYAGTSGGVGHIQQLKLSVLRTVYSKNKFRLNVTASLGAYCPRCIFEQPRWSGFWEDMYLTRDNNKFILIFKPNAINYTFINTFINVGTEAFWTLKKSAIGVFGDAEVAFGKNFDHTINFSRSTTENGTISLRNRGLMVRAGLFYRPYLKIKKEKKVNSYPNLK